MKPTTVLCTECRTEHAQKLQKKLVWPGMPRYECPTCGQRFLHPMTPGNRVVSWLFLAGMGWTLVKASITGAVVVPGLLGILFIWGLFRDHRAVRALREAKTAGTRASKTRSVASRVPLLEPPVTPAKKGAATQPMEQRLAALGFDIPRG